MLSMSIILLFYFLSVKVLDIFLIWNNLVINHFLCVCVTVTIHHAELAKGVAFVVQRIKPPSGTTLFHIGVLV